MLPKSWKTLPPSFSFSLSLLTKIFSRSSTPYSTPTTPPLPDLCHTHTHPWIDTASQLHPGPLKQRRPHTTKPPPPTTLGLAPCHYFDFIPVRDSVHVEVPLYVHHCPCHPRPCHLCLGGPSRLFASLLPWGSSASLPPLPRTYPKERKGHVWSLTVPGPLHSVAHQAPDVPS